MPDGFHAFGATLKFTSENTVIGEVTDISGPDIDVNEADLTHHSSSEGWKHFVPGTINPGTITFSGNFTTGGMQFLNDRLTSGTVGPVTLDLANNSSWSCDGFVVSLNTESNATDKEGYSASFKLTGEPTFATS